MRARVLIVDDEPNILSALDDILTDEGYEVILTDRAAAVLGLVEVEPPAVMLLDVMLPDGSGLDLLRTVKTSYPEVEVVVISGHATVDMAVEAIKAGAYDFVEKPLSMKRVLTTVARALERRNLALDCSAHSRAEEERYRIVGDSTAMKQVKAQIAMAAPTNARVLITGESGTGKELVAYWLHRNSLRRDRPFVKLNCAAIPRDLLESELFGYEKGAFSGATAPKPGRCELANTGTMFLDEIGDMDPLLQAKLLRVLESGEFERLGSTRMLRADIRFIAATNKNIKDEIEAGRFRADLYHRLNGFTLHVPALREHPEDIPMLAVYLLDAYCQDNGMPARQLSRDALAFLSSLPFPGNVRELKNLVERAAITARGSVIGREDLQVDCRHERPHESDLLTRTRPLSTARDELEKAYLERQLARFGWNISRAAVALEVERSHLSRRLKQLGIVKPEPYASQELSP